MANDRMFLRCSKCNESHYVAKWFCDGWYTASASTMESNLEHFLDAHQWCGDAGKVVSAWFETSPGEQPGPVVEWGGQTRKASRPTLRDCWKALRDAVRGLWA